MIPTVIARIKYYEKESDNRNFYASGVKDDYLGYIDKGITSTRSYDYVDYVSDKDKSYGVFDSYGILSKDDKKKLREALRKTDSVIWDLVISFEEKFGKDNIIGYQDAYEMMKSIFPKFLKKANFNLNNVVWFAGLHENTDNRHIHVSFFEKEPTYFNQQKKEYHFRKGKIKLDYLNELKMDAESYFTDNKELIKQSREKVLESLKSTLEDKYPFDYQNKFIPSLKRLIEEIPRTGRVSYNSKNMEELRPLVDEVSLFILNTGETCKKPYQEFLDQLEKDNGKFLKRAKDYNVNLSNGDYKDKVMKDLKRRVGNIVIQKIIEERDEAYKDLKNIQNAKMKRKAEYSKLGYLLKRAFEMNEDLDKDMYLEFEEFRKKLKLAEYQRLIEEGKIQAEM